MFKFIKKIIFLIILLTIVFIAGFFYYNYFDKGVAISKEQENIITEIGRPEQFTISYLPKGSDEGSEFVRHETWYYPSLRQKVSFLNGKLITTVNLDIEDGSKYNKTLLMSEEFDSFSTKQDIVKQIGEDNLAPIELPGFFGDGIETYASSEALFVFEGDYLTYMETLD